MSLPVLQLMLRLISISRWFFNSTPDVTSDAHGTDTRQRDVHGLR